MASPFDVPPHLLHPTRGDMSNYLVHFTKSETTLGAILTERKLEVGKPFGFSYFRNLPKIVDGHRSTCLSEIPLDHLQQLTSRHGRYGIGFSKEFIQSKAGARVWYLEEKTSQAVTLTNHLAELEAEGDWTSPLWELTPFIDFMMPSKNFTFAWEREWRVRGALRFALDDVAFVITPEGVNELPFEGIYLHPDYYPVVSAAIPSLEQHVEALLERFHQVFEDPANCLPVDGGEYVWIASEWDTDDAVYFLFEDEDETIQRELADYLNGESTAWVRSSDLDFEPDEDYDLEPEDEEE